MPLGYVGGKAKKTKFLKKHCPLNKFYKRIVLNCCGAGWLFLLEDFSHCNEVIFSDINPYLINMIKAFSVPEQFLTVFESYMKDNRELHLNPNETLDEAELRFSLLYKEWNKELYAKNLNMGEIDFIAAVQYAFLISHSFAGRHSLRAGFTYRDGNPMYPNFMKVLNKLKRKKYSQLLKKVIFESIDFEECLRKYDSPDTFFYIDPPYWGYEADYDVNNDLFGKYGHIRLADAVKKLKGLAMISYYNFTYLESLYPSSLFNKIGKDFHKSASNFKKKKSNEKEILITNYSSSGKKHSIMAQSSLSIENYIEIAGTVCPKSKKRTRKSYSTDFRRVIVDLIKLGVKKAELMRQFGIGSYSTLKRWEEKYKFSEVQSISKQAA